MSNIKNLLSDDFKRNIQHLFDKSCGKGTFGVITITRAYYVYIDINAGFEFSVIDYHRLVAFRLFLRNYVLVYNDDITKQLLDELKKFLVIK